MKIDNYLYFEMELDNNYNYNMVFVFKKNKKYNPNELIKLNELQIKDLCNNNDFYLTLIDTIEKMINYHEQEQIFKFEDKYINEIKRVYNYLKKDNAKLILDFFKA